MSSSTPPFSMHKKVISLKMQYIKYQSAVGCDKINRLTKLFSVKRPIDKIRSSLDKPTKTNSSNQNSSKMAKITSKKICIQSNHKIFGSSTVYDGLYTLPENNAKKNCFQYFLVNSMFQKHFLAPIDSVLSDGIITVVQKYSKYSNVLAISNSAWHTFQQILNQPFSYLKISPNFVKHKQNMVLNLSVLDVEQMSNVISSDGTKFSSFEEKFKQFIDYISDLENTSDVNGDLILFQIDQYLFLGQHTKYFTSSNDNSRSINVWPISAFRHVDIIHQVQKSITVSNENVQSRLKYQNIFCHFINIISQHFFKVSKQSANCQCYYCKVFFTSVIKFPSQMTQFSNQQEVAKVLFDMLRLKHSFVTNSHARYDDEMMLLDNTVHTAGYFRLQTNCNLCGMLLPNEIKLIKHRKLHFIPVSHSCVYCHNKFKRKFNRNVHQLHCLHKSQEINNETSSTSNKQSKMHAIKTSEPLVLLTNEVDDSVSSSNSPIRPSKLHSPSTVSSELSLPSTGSSKLPSPSLSELLPINTPATLSASGTASKRSCNGALSPRRPTSDIPLSTNNSDDTIGSVISCHKLAANLSVPVKTSRCEGNKMARNVGEDESPSDHTPVSYPLAVTVSSAHPDAITLSVSELSMTSSANKRSCIDTLAISQQQTDIPLTKIASVSHSAIPINKDKESKTDAESRPKITPRRKGTSTKTFSVPDESKCHPPFISTSIEVITSEEPVMFAPRKRKTCEKVFSTPLNGDPERQPQSNRLGQYADPNTSSPPSDSDKSETQSSTGHLQPLKKCRQRARVFTKKMSSQTCNNDVNLNLDNKDVFGSSSENVSSTKLLEQANYNPFSFSTKHKRYRHRRRHASFTSSNPSAAVPINNVLKSVHISKSSSDTDDYIMPHKKSTVSSSKENAKPSILPIKLSSQGLRKRKNVLNGKSKSSSYRKGKRSVSASSCEMENAQVISREVLFCLKHSSNERLSLKPIISSASSCVSQNSKDISYTQLRFQIDEGSDRDADVESS